jgi:HK97 family phage prohead protease
MTTLVIEGYASVWHTEADGDVPIVMTRGVTVRLGHDVPLLWRHATPIGHALAVVEDRIGLFVRARLAHTPMARALMPLLLDYGTAMGLSIGGLALQRRDIGGVRYPTEFRLREVSVTPTPANPDAHVTAIYAASFTETLAERLADLKARHPRRKERAQ